MPLYTDTTSHTVHELDPDKVGAGLIANLLRTGALVEGAVDGAIAADGVLFGAPVDDPVDEVALDDMTAAQLRAVADELGLDVPARAPKAEIVAAIDAARAAAADGDAGEPADTDNGDPAAEGDEG